MEGILLKFGCKPAKRDARNFRMSELLLTPKQYPRTYDFDTPYPDIPFPMWGNDQHGCCVVVSSVAQIMRQELVEQKRLINITTEDVLKQYYKETGGPDVGLVILDHLRNRRKEGILIGGHYYQIKAFAEIDRTSIPQVKATSSSQIGVKAGFALPDNWEKQLRKGRFDDCSMDPNEYNGHDMFSGFKYDSRNFFCHTWARKFSMSFPFFKKYCTEAYGTIDATNEWAVDVAALEDMLRKVSPGA